MTPKYSKAITCMRFPLAAFVVMQHSNPFSISLFGGGNFNLHSSPLLWTVTFLAGCLATIAVPTFFAISGFLLFNTVARFDVETYKSKIKKRFHTLIVPYVAWNVIALLILLAGSIAAGSDSGFAKIDWIEKVGSILLPMGNPPNFPLWFIRDLIYLVLLSPVIYWITKRMGVIFLLLMGLLFVTDVCPIQILPFKDIFFFSLGAYFCIKKKGDVVEWLERRWLWTIVVYMALCVADLCFSHYELGERSFRIARIGELYNIELIVGTAMSFALAAKMASNTKTYLKLRELATLSFTIYATHGLYINILKKMMFKLVYHGEDVNQWIAVCLFIVSISVCLAVSIVLYKVMQKNTLAKKYLLGNRG